MAYKFQLGNAKMAGTLQQAGGLVGTDVDDATAGNVVAQIDNGEIAIAKLAEKQISGKDLGTNLDSLSVAAASGLQMSSYNGSAAVSDLIVKLDGAGGMQKTASGVKIAAGGVTNAMLAGSIASAKIADLSTFNTANLAEGANLYYTDARVTTRVAAAASAAAVRGHISVSDSNAFDFSYSAGAISAVARFDPNGGLEESGDGLKLKAAVAGAGLTMTNGVVAAVAGANTGLAISANSMKMDAGNLPAITSNVMVASDSLIVHDASAAESKKVTMVEFGEYLADEDNGSVNCGLIADASGKLLVQADGSSVELFGNAMRVKASGITNAMLAGSVANAKLANSTISGKALGANLDALSVDDSSIEFSAGSAFNGSAASAIRIKASGITNAMLAGSIANAKLSNSTIGGVALGANIATLASAFNADLGGHIQFGNQASDRVSFAGPVRISGDLEVMGAVTSIQTETVEINDHNLVLDFNNSTSAVINGAGLTIEGGSGDDLTFAWSAAASAMELKLGSNIAKLKADIEGSIQESVLTIGDANEDLRVGINVATAAASAPRTWTLPASASLSVGQSIKIKAFANSGTHSLTIARDANAQKIDGAAANLTLESDSAAITLLYVAANEFIVM